MRIALEVLEAVELGWYLDYGMVKEGMKSTVQSLVNVSWEKLRTSASLPLRRIGHSTGAGHVLTLIVVKKLDLHGTNFPTLVLFHFCPLNLLIRR